MRPFTLLVKPTCADCNLRCEYCFYLEKCSLYPRSKKHRMTDEVLEQTIRTYMATPQPTYSIGWQGGEPTLMGLPFFKKVTALQEKYGRSGCSVGNGLQTNATLIDNAFAKHLAEYKFLVGCSLDGPPEIHDRYRKNAAGKPTHAAVMRGIEALKSHKVEFNILVLVSQSNVAHAKEIYRYLVDQGFLFHQYIPCVEFDDDGQLLPFAITGEEWGRFSCELFDEWYREDTLKVSIRHFDSVLLKLVDNQTNVCSMERNCCQYFVVEHNGDIYPCDFYVEPQLKLGNVMDTTWEAALASPVYAEFGARKANWNSACDTCPYLSLCAGDCTKHRLYGKTPERNLSWLCSGWKMFYEHSQDHFAELTGRVHQMRRDEQLLARQRMVRSDPRIASTGRNEPCPCGSGMKFKKCCGA